MPGEQLHVNHTILLDLSRHCIQTAAVREHRRLLTAAVEQPQPSAELALKISMLKTFLEQTDFRALRSRHPELAGQAAVRVELSFGSPATVVSWRIVTGPPSDPSSSDS